MMSKTVSRNTEAFLALVRAGLWERVADLLSHARIFPLDSMRFFPGILVSGVMGVLRGE